MPYVPWWRTKTSDAWFQSPGNRLSPSDENTTSPVVATLGGETPMSAALGGGTISP
jgi:hypothetical protein